MYRQCASEHTRNLLASYTPDLRYNTCMAGHHPTRTTLRFLNAKQVASGVRDSATVWTLRLGSLNGQAFPL
ncbi:hypothetical protein M407DRAFT_163427 [Tulasnella calospora MUT 4182]|uniref:Uncharacterized protein n=1 Tax=Tulasnella calospora MUT 4182 TaxID=1051891 RepID=A0A0C3QER0_9AGAM|nr:hypothetical protein M407DRAFT_163427 [Tulasnella calospora MUT 4182]